MKSILLFFLALCCISFYNCNSAKTVSANTGMVEITETYWRLTELKGKPVKAAAPGKKEVHIMLRKSGNIEGFAGCNGFGGHFDLKDSSRVSFSNIMGTMMACSDLETENKLFEVLRETVNYVHNGKHLMLIKGNKSPMARFEADYAK
ncbi:MAG: META domain-containing protein [Chitinophagaceae bacterium]